MSEMFYAALLVAVAVLLIMVIDLGRQFYQQRKPARMNSYLSERERQQASDRLLEALFPTKKGPGGFDAQLDRKAHVHPIRSRKVN